MTFNYQRICSNLVRDLPERTKNIISRRFGFETGKKETLESIGKSYGITRERIRQIELGGISRLTPKLKKKQKIFQYFTDYLGRFGDLKKEDLLLSQLGGQKFTPHISFLLSLSDRFQRFSETRDIHSLWTINPNSLNVAKEVIDDFHKKLKRTNQPLAFEHYTPPFSLDPNFLTSYLEISKLINRGIEGRYGLTEWPEINPRGVKDKAFLVLKREKRPLHFNEIARLIGPGALVQTVHNELIRDPRFVLVGRGIYALSDWGYKAGTVKDVISEILKKAGKPLSKKEILEKVLQQRLVRENTVLLNLSNKKYFSRNSQGKYILKNV